jgi:hypothetical protein
MAHAGARRASVSTFGGANAADGASTGAIRDAMARVTCNSYRSRAAGVRFGLGGTVAATMACRLRPTIASPLASEFAMPHPVEPSRAGLSNGSGARLRNAGETRSFPRCEPAYTHFELGALPEYRPTAVKAKRYTPRYGVRKE